MLFFFYQQQQVARRAATLAGIAFSAHAQLHTVLHTCRYVQAQCFFAIYAAFTFTVAAFCGNGAAFAITGRAGSYRLHLAKEGIRNPAYLAGAGTSTACLYRILVFSSAAVTLLAAYMLLYFYLLISAIGYFAKVHLQLYAQVSTTATLPSAAATLTTKHAAKHIVITEYISEIIENIFHAHATWSALATKAIIATGMAETVVLCTLIRAA